MEVLFDPISTTSDQTASYNTGSVQAGSFNFCAESTATSAVTGAVLSSATPASLWNQGTVSEAFFQAFVGVRVYISMSICCLSIIFSLLNASVYWVQRKSAYAVYLVGVSLGDGVYSLCDLVVNISNLVDAPTSYSRVAITWYLNIFLGTSIRRCAIWINLFASLERFFAIAFPLKASGTGIFSIAPARTILAVYVFICAWHCYNFLEYYLGLVGPGVWTLVSSTLKRDHPDEFNIFKNALRAVLFFLPLALSLVLNVALVVILKAHLVQRLAIRTSAGKSAGTRNSSSKHTDTHATKLILVFTITYVLWDLPRAINLIVPTYIKDYGVFQREYYLSQILTLCAQLLTHLTEVTLFLVCFAYSRQFRGTIRTMPCFLFVRRQWRKRTGSSVGSPSLDNLTNSSSCDQVVTATEP